ncbi:hypothetical protein A4H97_19870 [Niastella yeongjuensis]|uniref:Uncharacterized protein n=1 Tax=Niastella yeongjuensis TaxID=354355 RepID=A0A1V9FCF4_9BACT|nr:hypothetical protein A4H97_19870 [Niastella yeongjuensis]
MRWYHNGRVMGGDCPGMLQGLPGGPTGIAWCIRQYPGNVQAIPRQYPGDYTTIRLQEGYYPFITMLNKRDVITIMV